MRDHLAMPELPTGTVTFLFTDIEGSTRLIQEHGDQYAELLAEHRRRLREVFARNDGVEVETQGDSFFVAFARAADAVRAAAEAQESLSGEPVRVRIGIHTGTPFVTAEGYVGADVHVAARVMAAGHGGQVLVSEATQHLATDVAGLRDLGEHRLKDLGAPRRLYQLGNGEFPPLRTLYRTNLPIQLSSLIGRETELREAGELLRRHRLVTLTGPGGSGKTRLGMQLAADAVDDFPDGVFWVPLQAVREPAHVETAIALSVGADDGLIDYIGTQRLLLLVDNFEQVVEAASTISALLSGTPNTKVIVTSREPLLLDAERRYPVEPLPIDDAAVLFVERARAIIPDFEPTPSVPEICKRLDGLPLAIELAAARVALLGTTELLVRLERALPLLSSRSRDAPARQQTLRATIEWSHELLKPDEQALFCSLAVFRGSFTLEAAEAVCAADLETLESLVVKNLVRRLANGRLLMLDTIREFAIDKLEASPDSDAVRAAHADYYLSVAVAANLNAGMMRPGGQRLDLALPELDNCRGALTWCLKNGGIELGLRIAVALEQLWVLEDPNEGVTWFERFLEAPGADQVPMEDRAHAFRAYGSSLHIAGRPQAADEAARRSLALFEEIGDEQGQAVLLHRLSITATILGDLRRARELVERSDEIHRNADDKWGRAQTTGTLGSISRDEGDERSAMRLFRESAELAQQVGVPWWQGGALAELACVSIDVGLVDEAEEHARASLAISGMLRDRPGRVFGVAILARVAAERGQAERAGRLWAPVEEAEYASPLGGWMRHRPAFEVRMRELAGPDFERGYVDGKMLTLDEAVALAQQSA